jgi:hypothetical protein
MEGSVVGNTWESRSPRRSLNIALNRVLLLLLLYHHHHHQISHFSASGGKHSPILGYVINRIRLGGLIYNIKSFLQLNMFQELQIFAFVCMYLDAG